MSKQATANRRRLRVLWALPLLAPLATLSLGPSAAQGQVAGAEGIVCTTGAAGVDGPVFDLVATDGYVSMPDGASVYMWTYADATDGGIFQSPGPTLCVTEGDLVTVNLTNTLPEPVSLIFPGQVDVNAAGGSAGLFTSEAPADAGATRVTYTFTAGEAGTFLYESGTNPHIQVQMGLFGALIVRPAMGADFAYNDTRTQFNPAREFLLVYHEIDPVMHRAVARGQSYDVTKTHHEYFTLNGRAFPDTTAANGVTWLPGQPYGGLVRIEPYDETANPLPALVRYVNAGMLAHPIHPHGNNFRVIARDGALLVGAGEEDRSFETFTTTLGPGQTADLLANWVNVDNWDRDTNEVPVTVPGVQNLVFKDGLTYYSGSPYLGDQGTFPPDVTTFNQCGEYYFPLHSHALNEFVNADEAFGGMATMLRVDPPSPNDCP